MQLEDTWDGGKNHLTKSICSHHRGQSTDSTEKTNWIKIKIESKTIQEFIKISQRLQLTLYNAFYNSSPMIKSTNSPHTASPNITH
jgi:hypothetical protein